LIALDRCHHLYELKQVWERMYPDTKAGVAGAKAKHGYANEMFSFAAATAEKIGLSQRAIQMAVKIWTGLAPTVRARLRGADLSRKQTELKALSELPATRQIKVIDLILGDEHREIDNVASALLFIEGGIKPNAHERLFRVIHEGFAKLPDDTLDRLLVENEERVVASLRRMGRI
jgi:ParB family chromosome partitioning protein